MEGLGHIDCIVDPVDAGVPRPILFHHQLPQPGTYHPGQRHLVECHVLLGTVAIDLQPSEDLDDGAMERMFDR